MSMERVVFILTENKNGSLSSDIDMLLKKEELKTKMEEFKKSNNVKSIDSKGKSNN